MIFNLLKHCYIKRDISWQKNEILINSTLKLKHVNSYCQIVVENNLNLMNLSI